jgi:hypothetical protein
MKKILMSSMVALGMFILLFSPFSIIQNVEAQVTVDPPEPKTCKDFGLPKKTCEGEGFDNDKRRSTAESWSKMECRGEVNSCTRKYVSSCSAACKKAGALCGPKIKVSDNKQCSIDSCYPITLTKGGQVQIGGSGGGGTTTILSWDCKSKGSMSLECDCNDALVNPTLV